VVKNKIVYLLAVMICVSGAAAANTGAELRLSPAPGNRLDDESLQRGARTFVNYCLNCHSAKYMRYNRLTQIGLTEPQIRNNLMFATDKIGETMTVAMTQNNARTWFGALPPDLSVEARVRGRDWLYNYLLGFYRDDKAPSGWNNLVFPNVGMPHVLWELQGVNKLVETKFEDTEKATAAAIAAKGLAAVEPAANQEFVVLTLAPDTPGTMTRSQYEAMIGDLVNYLEFMAEPAKNQRINVGFVVLIFLGLLFALVYALKREYWKDVH
jgi:ubiquinol-cytochrome c reductase cytochrome c1 subunit